MRKRVTIFRTVRSVPLLATLAAIAVLTVGCTSQPAGDEAAGSASSATGAATSSASSADSAPYNGGVASQMPLPGPTSTRALVSTSGSASTLRTTGQEVPAKTVPTSAPVSTSGPLPASGNINQEVPAKTVPTNAPVALGGTADFGDKVSARLTEVKALDATAKRPGEVAGPAVAVTVEVSNTSKQPIGLDNVTVALADAAGKPGSMVSTDPAKPLVGVLNPGRQQSGTYVFTIPKDTRDRLAVSVSYSSGAPTVLFAGSM